MGNLPIPPKKAIFYEDERVYICLASFPITEGHTIVVWRNKVSDLHLLNRHDYEYLMDMVDIARDTLLKVLNLEKVYLMYLDEAKQVHWHLVPRYNERGFNVFKHEPVEAKDFALAGKLAETFAKLNVVKN